MKKIFIFSTIIALLFIIYLYLTPSVKTTYDFYYWKSTYDVNKSVATPKYVKVLDISFNETLSFRKTQFKTKLSSTVVPVIYIDNPLWKKMKASTMVKKIMAALKSMHLENNREIQIDCDWTEGSRGSYFEFLKLLGEQSGKVLSATIRLHQVKYHKETGAPPVGYGVLMYYNMSDFRDLETKNYILDLEVAKRYHYNFDTYPLDLNLALPLYSQATIIRFREVIGLIEGVREKELDNKFKRIDEHLFEVRETHYFKKRLLYVGDKIRVDEVRVALLKQSIEGLKKVMKEPSEIIFYRWGNLDFYGDENLKEIVETW